MPNGSECRRRVGSPQLPLRQPTRVLSEGTAFRKNKSNKESRRFLHEGWKVIDSTWNGQALGRTWNSHLSDKARDGLAFLGRYFSQNNLSRTIRDKFGFHYLIDPLCEPLTHISGETDEIMSGKQSGNIFYSFAEQLRAVALLRAALPENADRIWGYERHRRRYSTGCDTVVRGIHACSQSFRGLQTKC